MQGAAPRTMVMDRLNCRAIAKRAIMPEMERHPGEGATVGLKISANRPGG